LIGPETAKSATNRIAAFSEQEEVDALISGSHPVEIDTELVALFQEVAEIGRASREALNRLSK